ncbi:ABC transporter substrate-binding protein [uncultured Winogradskyella sp.]|uniref:type IX secretion system anionic LPS delivery protein PorZ n=1 Tax=uncultured Winogradskyella sp. TaxID=395353 RepID=UPI0035162B61
MKQWAIVILWIFVGFSNLLQGQNFSALWQSHYSYNTIVDVVSSDDAIYAAAQNAIFKYDPLTDDLETITTVEGLAGEQITTIYYSNDFDYLLIGYETGLMELYSVSEESVLTIVDILDQDNITPINKRINHFFENEGLIYISTDYGISVYDLDRLEFGDTYFIGNGGTQVSVNQVAIQGSNIYAACSNNNGLKIADLNSPNLIDFEEWSILIPGSFVTANPFNNSVYAVRSNRELFEIDQSTFNSIATLEALPLDSESNANNLIFATAAAVYIYNTNLILDNTFVPNEEFDTSFSSATIQGTFVYIGSQDFGVLTNISSGSEYIDIKPNGPLFNETFRLNAETGTVWASFGDYTESFNPSPTRARGISYYRDEEWFSIPFDSLLGARNLNTISINPFNNNQLFISSFQDGILQIDNFESTVLYNESNSGLESLVVPNAPNVVSIRVSASTFDTNGVLWSLTSRAPNPLKSYDPSTGNWQGYDFSSIYNDPLTGEFGFYDIDIDNTGTKWIGGYSNGLYAFNESISNNPLRTLSTEEQNVPFPRITSLAVDNRNQLWVGTFTGLRVLFNTAGFYDNPNPSLSSIIVLEDGIPQELLAGQTISDIEVDGSNNKWVGTVDSGLFYFSPDGQNTIYHFTTDNSPLPSNRIIDVSINPQDGSVFIATTRGLLSFRAGGSQPEESLDQAYVYPNPVRPEYNLLGSNDLNDITKGIKITGLTERVNIKITDIEGNLVAEAQSNVNLRSSAANYNFAIDGGTAIWNGKNLANAVVRSGVYLILISDLDTFETKVLKVLIIR